MGTALLVITTQKRKSVVNYYNSKTKKNEQGLTSVPHTWKFHHDIYTLSIYGTTRQNIIDHPGPGTKTQSTVDANLMHSGMKE